ncbi:TetR/AcrR family transcriptional regulator [Paraburkholderia sp. CNPSo 3076]|uniref:TetR/AcrR family transcriptional regulator n=1 Tax=Paraburkholderia sp. CNPSo 3076 TaxID=2940936 RepID=UPI00224F1569|nr:TetR/AcrR family transcriptional regulator [Paraburkholderia sp. CNPSo 3076]MCX5539996.1 TetR/AcrR family transcriptional regulator [Paraburkholderia sp. CNPSo 3076]
MSGKPQFDDAAVIDAAMRVFWRHGYAAASINHLTEATGLSRSSLYQRFGDKDGLFREALAAYTKRVLNRMNGVEADTARGRLEGILRAYLLRATPDRKRPAGCLISRSCAEMVDLTADGKAAARASAGLQYEMLAGLLRDGIANGELPNDTRVDALAWLYLGVLHSLLNLPQAGASADALDRMIDIAMSTWPPSSHAQPAST